MGKVLTFSERMDFKQVLKYQQMSKTDYDLQLYTTNKSSTYYNYPLVQVKLYKWNFPNPSLCCLMIRKLSTVCKFTSIYIITETNWTTYKFMETCEINYLRFQAYQFYLCYWEKIREGSTSPFWFIAATIHKKLGFARFLLLFFSL